MTIVTHRKFIPAYLGGPRDGWPICLYTLLSINEMAGDCAAYEVIGPQKADEELIEKMKGGGNKIPEADARKLFSEIEDMNLRYRR